MDLVAALLLVLDEDRQLAEDPCAARLPVVLPGDRPQVDDLEVLAQRAQDLVDVRELIALGVDAEVVRVALQRPGRRCCRRRRLPRRDHRQVRVHAPVGLALEQVDPVVELAVLGLLVAARPSRRTSGGTASGSAPARSRPARSRGRRGPGRRAPCGRSGRRRTRSTGPGTSKRTVVGRRPSPATAGLPWWSDTARATGSAPCSGTCPGTRTRSRRR